MAALILAVPLGGAILMSDRAWAQLPAPDPSVPMASLKTVPRPEIPNLGEFVLDGVSPFGQRDAGAKVYQQNETGGVDAVSVVIPHSSLASQAVGPPLSFFEMSCDGRARSPDVCSHSPTKVRSPTA